MKPSEKAKRIAEAKKELGTAKAVALSFGMSASTVGLYLKLDKLTKKEKRDFDNGRKTLSSLRGKRKKPSVLSNTLKDEVLEIAARIRFFTVKQISGYSKCTEREINKVVNFFIQIRIIEKDSDLNFYTLTSRGWGFVDGSQPKHFVSASAVHQQLIRNDIELSMREKNASATFLNTRDAWERGLYPSIGEHALLFNHEGNRSMALVMIDDYHMSLTRIAKSLFRYHDKKKTVTQGERIVRWCDVISHCFIYTIGSKQQENIKSFIERKKGQLPIKPIVRTIEPYWEVR